MALSVEHRLLRRFLYDHQKRADMAGTTDVCACDICHDTQAVLAEDGEAVPPLDPQPLTDKARRAVDAFRDWSREHGLHFRQRDPLVMDIHSALDAFDAYVAAVRAASQQKPEGVPPLDPLNLERWRIFYRALSWMVNDYIGVSGVDDFTQPHERLGHAHEGYHNARRVLREHKPPVPDGMQQGVVCVCASREKGSFAGTAHRHYDEPPYSCARCECKAYEPAEVAAVRAASTQKPESVPPLDPPHTTFGKELQALETYVMLLRPFEIPAGSDDAEIAVDNQSEILFRLRQLRADAELAAVRAAAVSPQPPEVKE